MRALLISISILSALSGCSLTLLDSTDGDEGRTEWRLADGACPGLGGCALDVPVAVGADLTFDVEVHDGSLVAELTPVLMDEGSGLITSVNRDAERESIRFHVLVTEPGTVELRLVDPEGVLDSTRFEARRPQIMRCGRQPPGQSLDYEMPGLLDQHEVSFVDDEDPPQLACLITDVEGVALLSTDLVEWRVVSGTDLVRVQDEAFDFSPDDTAQGARVYLNRVDVDATGNATIEASLGDYTETFLISLE